MGLEEKASKWKEALNNAAVGPNFIAKEIVEIADSWDVYREEAGGLSANEWIRVTLKRTLAFFRHRYEAFEKLGEGNRRSIHHAVAVQIVNSVPQPLWRKCVEELVKAKNANRGNVVEFEHAQPILAAIRGPSRRRRSCRKCAELEARILELESLLDEQTMPSPDKSGPSLVVTRPGFTERSELA